MSWSYELLGEAERRLLSRLSVLRGDSALRWPNRSPAVAGPLASLAGKPLAQV